MIPPIQLKVKQLYFVLSYLYTLNTFGGSMIFRNRFAIAVFAGVLTVCTAAFSQGSISETTDQNAATADQSTADSSESLPQVIADTPNDSSLQQQKADSTQIVQPSIESTVAQQVSSDSNKITTVQEKPAPKYKSHLIGIGADFGLQFFAPAEINEYLEDVYDNMKDEYLGDLRCRHSQNVSRFQFRRASHGSPDPLDGIWCNRKMFLYDKRTGNLYQFSYEYDDPEFSAVVMDGIIGGKVETYTSPAKTVSFKGGFSVEAHFATVELEQKHTVTLKGNGIGITPFAGISIAPGRGIVMINVDFMVPICKIDLDEVEGRFDRTSDSYTYDDYNQPYPLPKELNLTGLIIKPSVTICFP